MKRLAVYALALLGAIRLGIGAEGADGAAAWDLQAVVTRALAANPDIKAAKQQVTAAEAKAREAAAARLPRVQGEAGYLQLDRDPSFTVPGMGTLTFGKADNPFADLSLEWPIYSGGMIPRMIAASRRGVDAAWQGYARTRQEITAEAAVAYYQALSAERMIGVMREQAATLAEALRIANGLHDQGMVAKLDVLRPTADLAGAQAMQVQAENGYQLALANLRRILDLPADAALTLTPSAPAEPAVREPAAAIAAALARRPEVKQLQAYLAAAEAQRKAAGSENLPHLGLRVQYDFKRPTTYPEIGDWTAALVVQQSFYNGGAARARADQAAAQRDELKEKAEALRQGIAMQVTGALLSLQAAEKRVQATTQAQAAAGEAYRAAEVSYKNQVVTMVDVLAAQTALTAARSQLALAEFDERTARIQYRLAMGEDQ